MDKWEQTIIPETPKIKAKTIRTGQRLSVCFLQDKLAYYQKIRKSGSFSV
jgi:hypothetical protein